MKFVFTVILFMSISFSYGQREKVLIDTLGADSIVQAFHSNGQLFYQVPYKYGMQNGWYEQYHENGTVWAKDLRVSGQTVDCFHREFNDDGTLYREGFIKNGIQIGKWYAYTNNGEPFKIYIYNKKGEWVKLKVWNEKRKKWERSGLY
jgi:antitoxin component YwqK of YwqJK toxin-antitoxin module